MRILHLASEYPPQQVFGLGRFVRDLSEEQSNQGHHVTVITNSIGGALYDSNQNHVRVMRVDLPPPKPTSTIGQVIVFNILLLRRFLSLTIVERSNLDVVCSHDWLTAPSAQAISELLGIPHICTFHDVINGRRLGNLNFEDRWLADTERWAADKATQIIANSRSTKDELIRTYNVTAEKIAVVPCAVAAHTFQVTDDNDRLYAFRRTFAHPEEILFMYAGRLDIEKGIDVLISAFARADIPKAKLIIAGTGILLETLQDEVRKAGIEHRVEFVGYVENPALAHLYKCADVLICPSRYEPFGMVAAEGMLQGTTVVASNIGGLSELIENGVNGILFPPGDENVLSEILTDIAKRPQERLRMGLSAQKHIRKNHTWSSASTNTVRVYRSKERSVTHSTLPSNPHLLLCEDCLNGDEYSVGHMGRRIYQILGEKGENPLLITNQRDDLFSVKPYGREDCSILRALQLAVRLLRYADKSNLKLECCHWTAMLAASILPSAPEINLYLCNTGSEIIGGQNSERFGSETTDWAAGKVNCIFVQNQKTMARVNSLGKNVTLEPRFAPAFPACTIIDEALFRASLGTSNDHVIVVAMRLELPFSIEVLIRTAEACKRAAITNIQWIVCGDGSLLKEACAVVSKRHLKMAFLGHLSPTVLSGILHNSQLAFIPLLTPHYTAFVEEAHSCSVRTMVPSGMSSLYSFTGLYEFNPANPDATAQQILNLLLSRPHGEASAVNLTEQKLEAQPPVLQSLTPDEIVLHNDWGIGDELLLSAVAREIRRAHPEKRVWIRSRHGFRFPDFCQQDPPPESAVRVETIYQNPSLYGPSNHAPFPGHLVEQMLDKVALDTGIRVLAKDLRPSVKIGKGIVRQDKLVALHCRPSPRLPTKDWGVRRWDRLCQLLERRGYSIVQLGTLEDPPLLNTIDKRGLPPSAIPDVVATASLVICLVGFLMHVAAATNTPTIVIYGGREHPLIDGYADQFHICSEAMDCRGRWGCHLPADSACPHGMRCMDDISPEIIDEFASLFITKGA